MELPKLAPAVSPTQAADITLYTPTQYPQPKQLASFFAAPPTPTALEKNLLTVQGDFGKLTEVEMAN